MTWMLKLLMPTQEFPDRILLGVVDHTQPKDWGERRNSKWQMMINHKLNNKLVHMIYPISSTDKEYFCKKKLTKYFNLKLNKV